jgi:hydrogenase/urease accessory protein HupE
MSLDDFVSGLLHPLLVPAHAIAVLAAALLIGQQRRRLVPSAAFVVALAAGLAALTRGVEQPAALDVLLATTALAGGLVALAVALPSPICALLAAIVGATLGLDSPPQAVSLAAATAPLIGNGIGASLALVLIVTVTSCLARGWQRIGVRILGSWITASAMLVLALRCARGMLF